MCDISDKDIPARTSMHVWFLRIDSGANAGWIWLGRIFIHFGRVPSLLGLASGRADLGSKSSHARMLPH